jgi:hypothetical protein
MRAFNRVCVELSALLVGTVAIGLVSAWALPLAGLILSLSGLTVLIERERQLEPSDEAEARPVELPPVRSVRPSMALVAYRPPGPLVRWEEARPGPSEPARTGAGSG